VGFVHADFGHNFRVEVSVSRWISEILGLDVSTPGQVVLCTQKNGSAGRFTCQELAQFTALRAGLRSSPEPAKPGLPIGSNDQAVQIEIVEGIQVALMNTLLTWHA